MRSAKHLEGTTLIDIITTMNTINNIDILTTMNTINKMITTSIISTNNTKEYLN